MKFTFQTSDPRLLAGLDAATSFAQAASPTAFLQETFEAALDSYAKRWVDTPDAVREWVAKQADPVAAVAVVAQEAADAALAATPISDPQESLKL